MIRERVFNGRPGFRMFFLFLALFLVSVAGLILSIRAGLGIGALISVLLMLTALFCECGLFLVNPNEGKVLQLFGDYKGTAQLPGLRWANPLYMKKKVSVRTRNFETGKLKVNDHSGNPIEIATVVVWRVVDTAEALFNVDDYVNFVHVQSEAALRNLATQYAYVPEREGEMALSSHTAEISGAALWRDPGAPGSGRCGGARGADQPSRLCARDRLGHAPAPAGQRRGRRPLQDRGRRRGHGRARAGDAVGEAGRGAR